MMSLYTTAVLSCAMRMRVKSPDTMNYGINTWPNVYKRLRRVYGFSHVCTFRGEFEKQSSSRAANSHGNREQKDEGKGLFVSNSPRMDISIRGSFPIGTERVAFHTCFVPLRISCFVCLVYVSLCKTMCMYVVWQQVKGKKAKALPAVEEEEMEVEQVEVKSKKKSKKEGEYFYHPLPTSICT